jgi:signal transduction histidine kinase
LIDPDQFIQLVERIMLAVYLLETVQDENGYIIDFRFIYINRQGELQIGMPRDQVIGRRLFDLIPTMSRFLDTYRQAVETGQAVEGQYEIPEGTPAAGWWYHQIVPMRGGIAIGRREITDAKQAEAAQIQQAALEAALEKETDLSRFKSEMMRRISHEFRTPLTRIGLAGDMIERYFDQMSREQVNERIRSIREGIAQLEAMLSALSLAVSGLEITRSDEMLETLDLREFCLDLVQRHRVTHFNGRNIVLSTKSTIPLTINRRLLELVLVNLLSNAAKFSPTGSDIRIDITLNDDSVTIAIRDSGIGILPEDIDYIFQPFYRGRNFDEIPGIGVGLTIVRNALDLLGGTIEIESQPRLGTTVRVTLSR